MPEETSLNEDYCRTLTAKGNKTQLTATVEPSDATNKNGTWKSSDIIVATVDANGLVTAVGNGTATITVTTVGGGLTATITVKISSGDTEKPGDAATPDNKPSGDTKNTTTATAPKTGDDKSISEK